jgi:hypothetical protein
MLLLVVGQGSERLGREWRELWHEANRVPEDCRVDLPVEGEIAERSAIVVISALCAKGEIAFYCETSRPI